jgi:hypothetical protein
MKDFFISYNREDKQWAEWIAWQLEDAGFTTMIQAWDFVGNWVIRMNEAMQKTARTIAVLSPNYVKALYTQSEWANAFRLDPTGEKDLLIPVRVQPVELDGVLAQIVYVDLVNVHETEAIERLLKRVRGERDKPSSSPALPSSASATDRATHAKPAASKPVYPAFDEDTERLIRARQILVNWRSRYAGQEDALRRAGEKARSWSRDLPTQFDDEVAAVLDLAARVACDLRSLPLSEIEFAQAYGLMVHRTVFWGQALEDVDVTHSVYGSGHSDVRKEFNDARKARGLRVIEMPDKYAFEMVARVLESADALARFRFDSLPRGFIDGAGPAPASDLRAYQTLFIARTDNDPRLHVMTADQQPLKLGTFAARQLALYPLCARRNVDGSLDVLATDFQYVYRWSQSSSQPSMQYATKGGIVCASFISSEVDAPAVTVHGDGETTLLEANGRMKTLLTLASDSHVDRATVWMDPLKAEQWHLLSLSRAALVSQSLAGVNSSRSNETLCNGSLFPGTPAASDPIRWNDNSELCMHVLDGLPCLVVRREGEGACGTFSGVHFLDPLSLAPIRQPLFIAGFIGNMVIAGGRWLAVFFLQRGGILPRVAVWDLRTTTEEPVGRWFERKGDVYYPFVTKETEDTFEVIFVFRLWDSSDDRWLCRFRWPSGSVEELEKYADLRVLPVA